MNYDYKTLPPVVLLLLLPLIIVAAKCKKSKTKWLLLHFIGKETFLFFVTG